MRLEKLCTLCKEKPHVKINKLNYCNDCFVKMFEMKCHRSLRGLPYKSRILILLNDSLSSSVLLKVLSNYRNKSNQLFSAFRTDTKVIDTSQLNEYGLHILANNNSIIQNTNAPNIENISKIVDDLSSLNTVIQTLRIDFVIHQMTVERQSAKVFLDICNGEHITRSIFDTTCIIENQPVQFLNVFQDVKLKEVLYYGYLNNLNNSPHVSNTNEGKLTSIIDKFIRKIDNDNSLALFNIIKTVKKLE